MQDQHRAAHLVQQMRDSRVVDDVPPEGLPDCPGHLLDVAKDEWAALAAYCQAYGRWVEAEEKLKETPVMLKTPSGYVQQSP